MAFIKLAQVLDHRLSVLADFQALERSEVLELRQRIASRRQEINALLVHYRPEGFVIGNRNWTYVVRTVVFRPFLLLPKLHIAEEFNTSLELSVSIQ